MKTSIIIPARLNSTRFPRKMLATHNGKTLIQYTYENAKKAGFQVIVATDSEEIVNAVRCFNGEVALTGPCNNGSDRVAEVACGLDADTIINVQGDEPEVFPGDLKRLAHETIIQRMATLVTVLDQEDAHNDNVVKAVLDGPRAVFFSRFPLASEPGLYYQHIGVYAYQRQALLEINRHKHTPLEKIENLEQMRPLAMGIRIMTCLTMFPTVGIDIESDFEAFKQRLDAKTRKN